MHYNDPDISARDFLDACMHDPELSLDSPMRAAKTLMKLGPPPPPPPPPTVLIKIGGFICPELIDTWDFFSSEECGQATRALQ